MFRGIIKNSFLPTCVDSSNIMLLLFLFIRAFIRFHRYVIDSIPLIRAFIRFHRYVIDSIPILSHIFTVNYLKLFRAHLDVIASDFMHDYYRSTLLSLLIFSIQFTLYLVIDEVLLQSCHLSFPDESKSDNIGDISKVSNNQNSKNCHENVANVELHTKV